jgi:UDP-2-acetamido-3-amino-2,3-dideoxy-glucuronate N-acetyltransferase
MKKNYYLHKSSYLDEKVKIGDGTKIWHFSHVLRNSTIGKKCIIGQNVAIGPEVSIGDGCKIQNNVSIFKGVTLKKNVFCAPSAVFTNVVNPRAFIERKDEFKKTFVEEGATIGANATILCGNKIGKYSFIGAGAVLSKSTPDYSLFIGVPAKQIGWVCKCGNVLTKKVISEIKEEISCSCDNLYLHEGDKLSPIKEK